MPFPKRGCPAAIEDCAEVSLKNKSGWSIQGFSKAGERTSFKLNPLNIMMDAGLLAVVPPKAVLMTHGHIDHSWNLPNATGGSRAILKDETIPVYFPKQAYAGLTMMLQAVCTLSYPKESFSAEKAWEKHFMEPKPISAGDKFSVGRTKIEVLSAVHTAQAVGYGFSTEKTKLKKEFEPLSEDHAKIIELRKQGMEISEKVLQPELAFFCDSTIDNLLNYSEWTKYPSVVVECTGYPELYDADIVHKRGHTHYDDLIKVMERNADKNWFFIHSTMKSDGPFLKKYEELLKQNFKVEILSQF